MMWEWSAYSEGLELWSDHSWSEVGKKCECMMCLRFGCGQSARCRGCCFGLFRVATATTPPCPVRRQPVMQEGLIVSDAVVREVTFVRQTFNWGGRQTFNCNCRGCFWKNKRKTSSSSDGPKTRTRRSLFQSLSRGLLLVPQKKLTNN